MSYAFGKKLKIQTKMTVMLITKTRTIILHSLSIVITCISSCNKSEPDQGNAVAVITPEQDLTRETALIVLENFYKKSPVDRLYFVNSIFSLNDAVDAGYIIPESMSPSRVGSIFTDKGAAIARIIEEDAGIGGIGYDMTDPRRLHWLILRSPIQQRVSSVTGLAPAPAMGDDARRVEYTIELVLPSDFDEGFKKFIHTKLVRKSILVKYDDGWRVESTE